MKKFVLTILLLMSPAFAFEDYMIILPDAVKSVSIQNKEIVDVNVLYTIDNTKKFVIVTPKKTGETKIYLLTDDGYKNLKVDVEETHTKIETSDNLEYYVLDTPPEYPYIPLPPAYIDIPEPPRGVK